MTSDKQMVIIGKNILDNLTTGMYEDSRVIYREYIQNACDQIDIAKQNGVLSDNNPGSISIAIDPKKRSIIIEDNATGVKKDEFIENVYNIADSNKIRGVNRGFRGIGRLCGLAYCKTLRFTTSAQGENIASVMECNAHEMRLLLGNGEKSSVQEIWEKITTFKTKSEDVKNHYFRVELIDVIEEDEQLLKENDIYNYLSFVAPVPYKNVFDFSKKIHQHSNEIKMPIDEYNIDINGKPLFKGYKKYLYDSAIAGLKEYDKISNVEFKDFFDESGKLIAWMWYGISRFEKNIPETNLMRGIRLRSGNIQLGDSSTLQKFFKESRGNGYFVGELFVIDKQLIPNSQRNYFNENEARVNFENIIRDFFYVTLHKLYRDANEIKNAYKAQENYTILQNEFDLKNQNNDFINQQDKEKAQQKVQEAKEKAEKGSKKLSSINDKRNSSATKEIIKNYSIKYSAKESVPKTDETEKQPKKAKFLSDTFSKLDRKERKLVQRILSIIIDTAPKDIAADIIARIKKELG